MLDINALDRILNQIFKDTLDALDRRKIQVYNVLENSRLEFARLTEELTRVKKELLEVRAQVDDLSYKGKKATLRLMEIKKNFNKYTDEVIKNVYDHTYNLQLEIFKLGEKEKALEQQCAQIEKSLQQFRETVARAEKIIAQVGVVYSFLGSGLNDLSSKIGEYRQAQHLALSIIKAQEEERKRLAREIHDSPAQSMANIVMRAEYCLKLLDLDPAKVREELVALQELVRMSLMDVRKIIFDLRPMVLDDLGLVPAIKRYLSDCRLQNEHPIEFLFFGQPRRLDTSVEVALFRIVQEAVTNIRKHAQANNALVKVEVLENKINIHIKDDGLGFEQDKVMVERSAEGYGLVGIRERVQLLKGEMSITSSPGNGTALCVSVPTDY
ncbi:Signal transduction histidine-protein kinase/phosphatase DegS [Pelotomaculum schinkii]|uniref:Oxygen sensor histidine kinase NreB n=1 Tax=Pelotomaculum schinkii TaxID=78350 RepID=A0A4Y7RE04_9FIRM|nr:MULTISPECIES: sensor histidine kinase [Pelotomaculum]TEB07003.1 Signal transduction histidine-protein kinase/phosphatase DegS [Pelotomaculum schinkii]TEB16840.1 Signal transduction histidine-protein kinase/phosphatase DegS [Pelotomaculum sp. FP]